MSHKTNPESLGALLRHKTHNKENYLSSDTSTITASASTQSVSMMGASHPQSSDENVSDAHNSSRHHVHNNPHLISNKYVTDRRRSSRRKKHSPSKASKTKHRYPPPQYPPVPAHGDVAVTSSFTPPPNHSALSRYYDTQKSSDADVEIPNAEPSDEVNPNNKLFSDSGGLDGSREHRSTTATNYSRFCSFKCDLDMEDVFEVIETLILFVFIAFIAVWWEHRHDKTLLLFTLTICCGVFGLLALNMRRVQSSLRLHELGSTLNDFRFILLTLGLIALIIADQLRYASDDLRLWIAHSFVFAIAAMLWCTIDFATYMSYFVSTAYHVFVLTGTILEFARVCYQIQDDTDIPVTMFEHNGVLYTVYDFKMDGVILMLMAEISSIITLIRDRKREWYCFGATHVYRHRLLEISRRQRGMIHAHSSVRMRNHDKPAHVYSYNDMSGYSYTLQASNDDSLLLIWIINLSCIAYMTFFVWDLHSVYKSIPAAVGILAIIVLVHRECDFHLVSLIKEQTHSWFTGFALLELWFVTLYSSLHVDGTADQMWKQIGSYFVDMTVLSMACVLLFVTDLLVSTVSSYFILRGTLPVMLLFVSLCCVWYQSFYVDLMKNDMDWTMAVICNFCIRNGYFIICTMSIMSVVKWIKDPLHKYFIFILTRRKRSIVNEHKYRMHHGMSRDPSTTNPNQALTPIGNSLLLHRGYPDTNSNITNHWK
eukprot:137464_1